jgi:hypothetical protein
MNGSMKAGLALLAVCIAVFCCCAGEGDMSNRKTGDLEAYPWELGTFEGLSAETEWQIIQDCYDSFKRREPPYSSVSINDLRVINYYGTYNGYVVVKVYRFNKGPERVAPHPDGIRDIELPWLAPWLPTVWKDGQFYGRVTDLYSSGPLTLGDLESIARHPKEWDVSEYVYGWVK